MGLPRIQHADRVGIAYYVLGHGLPIAVLFPYHVNHLALNWQVPLHRGAFEFLARSFSVVNLDFRGAGASRRTLSSLSLDDLVDDLLSVAASLRIRRLALCALGDAALVACRFASRFPARVASMVLIAAGESEMNRRVLSLRHMNPALEARMRGALLGGLDDERNASALAAVAQEAIGSKALELWEKLLGACSLSSVAAQVQSPVLWLHASNDKLVEIDRVRATIGCMPSAELMVVPGNSGMDIWRDHSAMNMMLHFVARGFGGRIKIESSRRRRPPNGDCCAAGLSQREAEVLRCVAAGHTNKIISQDLFISLNTVSYHLRNIFRKTGATNRTEAASFAHRRGMFAGLSRTESA